MSERTIGLLLIAVVALGAMTGVAAAEGDLGVTVDDADGEPTVAVTENGTAVENATVTVSVADPANESYAGAGEYATDENGTVDLEAPEEDVTVEVTAEYENDSAATTVDLRAPDGLELDVSNTDGEPVVTVTDDDAGVDNASVNVTTADGQNATYAGEGGYETDENGTVTLPAAEEEVTIDVTAEYGNESVSTTVGLSADGGEAGNQPFGQFVRDFIERLEDREGGIGGAVSDFVTENNPGNAPDHAGGPGGPDEANGDDAEEDDDAENESDAPGNGNAPDHAGNGDDRDDDDTGDDDADDDDAEDDDADDDDAEDDDTDEDDAEENDAEEGDAEEDDADEDDAEEDDADEDDAEEDDEDDGESGPPDHAGGPGGN